MNWIIHIGAHKTATTHIQDSLASASSQLSEFGIFYLSRNKSRPLLHQGINWALRPKRYYLNIFLLRHRLIRLAHKQGCKSLLLSEENLLGSAADSLKYPIYPNAEIGMSFINQIKREDKLKLFLCIRGFDAVAPGAYVTALRFKNITPKDKASYIKKIKQQPPQWINLVERLLRSPPTNMKLKVWRYEDYCNNREFVLQSLIDDAAFAVPNLPPPKETATPSKKAVLLAEDFFRYTDVNSEKSNWTSEIDKIYSQYPVKSGSDKFDFLDQESIEILKKAYNDDCKKILERWPDIALFR